MGITTNVFQLHSEVCPYSKSAKGSAERIILTIWKKDSY